MRLKSSMTAVAAGLAMLAAAAGGGPIASAQEYPVWERGSRWGRMRPPPPPVDPYDDRSDDSDEPRYDPQPVQRPQPRRNGWSWDDDRERYERGEDNRRYRYRRFDFRQRDARTIDDQDYWRGNDRRRDTAREPQPQDEQGKVAGADGGPQPFITPLPPPRVAFAGGYAPGSIIIDTSGRKLYYVTGPTSAFAYPIGVGREGFAWTGAEKISRIADWPDWYPPAEMRKRKPELPERMLGGLRNPLGAKAMYLGNTLYRIHGTNDPKSIGKAESSGCFRMLNEHVLHLATLAGVGTQVTIVKSLGTAKVAVKAPPSRATLSNQRPPPIRWRPRDDFAPDYR